MYKERSQYKWSNSSQTGELSVNYEINHLTPDYRCQIAEIRNQPVRIGQPLPKGKILVQSTSINKEGGEIIGGPFDKNRENFIQL